MEKMPTLEKGSVMGDLKSNEAKFVGGLVSLPAKVFGEILEKVTELVDTGEKYERP